MIRTSRLNPEEVSEGFQFDANLGFDPRRDGACGGGHASTVVGSHNRRHPATSISSGPPEPLYVGHNQTDGMRTFPVRQAHRGGPGWRENQGRRIANCQGQRSETGARSLSYRKKEPRREESPRALSRQCGAFCSSLNNIGCISESAASFPFARSAVI